MLALLLTVPLVTCACGASRPSEFFLATTGQMFSVEDKVAFNKALVASAVSDGHCNSSHDVVVIVESSRTSVVDACGTRLTYVVDHNWTLVLSSKMPLAK